jgi:hypothetical protein
MDSKRRKFSNRGEKRAIRRKSYVRYFFMANGRLRIYQLLSGTSINDKYYRDQSLKSLVKDRYKNRSLSTANHVKLHHGNTRPHINDTIFNYLQEEKNESYGSSTILIRACYFTNLVVQSTET